MTSPSSKRAVTNRAQEFWTNERIWVDKKNLKSDIKKIQNFIQKEYEKIPQKERIGKGQVFIARATAIGCFNISRKTQEFDLLNQIKSVFAIGEAELDHGLINFALILLSEYVSQSIDCFNESFALIEKWANHDHWEIRENSCYTIRKGLKHFTEHTLAILNTWVNSEKKNIRRQTAESLRPLSDIKWLRNPEKNDIVFDILAKLRADPSVYVRKAVGNNLKDLSKYMPEKVLKIAKQWILDSKIKVTYDLASKTKKGLGQEENFALIWTLKHALRWLRERNPEFHDEIEEILGKNYVLHYDEKKNKLAIPKKSL
ncbi:MAG: DNA alkylation repair protein [Candidatus Hodarchaeales archaeon]|jgi:3-methyladenine DNA glycosylase AlkC